MSMELAKRAVACKHWRWLPGMLATDGVSIACRAYNDGIALRWATNVPDWPLYSVDENEEFLPRREDPATLGCLLSLVRKAREEQTYLPTCIDHLDEAWVIEPPSKVRQTRYESYAEALVAALEAAP